MKLAFDSLEYSRTAGMFTISGKGYLEVARKMCEEVGVDSVEHDEDNSEFVATFNKGYFDVAGIKQLYKDCK